MKSRRIRRPIAVIVSRFPLITETFILREIIELERRGQPVVLVSMIREEPEVAHAESREWSDRLIHAPFFSLRVLLAFARAWFRSPQTMGSLLIWILIRSITSPRLFAKSLLLFPQATFFAEQLEHQGIRHLHAHFATHPTTIAHVISRLTGINYSFTVHAHDIFVDRRLLREKVAAAAFIRAISRFNKTFLENLYPREAAEKIQVVHVGIEPGAYTGQPATARPEERPARVLCIAAMKPYKGLSFLIETCRLLVAEGADFTLDIIGSGPLRARIQEQISAANLSDHVRLLGPMPQDKVAAALHACDLFVLPSVVASDGQMEGIPVALMEAMAACKPVIASSISGIPELVEDYKNGLLVDPANPRQLAEAIRTLLVDPELRKRLGHAAREKVLEQFTLEGTVGSLLDVLDRHHPPADGTELRLFEGVLEMSASYGIVHSHAGPDSIVHELIESRSRQCRRMVVKRHLTRPGESRPADLRCTEEYELLERLHSWFDDEPGKAGSIRVPQPLALDRASATLAMTRAEGVPLDSALRAARSGSRKERARLADAVRLSGIWLESFQNFERQDGSEALGRLHSRALADLALVRESLGSRRAVGLEARIGKLVDAVALEQTHAVSHHGDLWPGNIFVTDDAAEVIDLEGYTLALPTEDIAYLFIHTGLYLAYRAESCLEQFRTSFLEGYGREVSSSELKLSTIAAALQLYSRRTNGQSFVHRFIADRYIRRELLS